VQFLAGSGRTFNVEERASIQSALHMLKAEQVGPLQIARALPAAQCLGLQGFARVQLWGKIFGQKTDYIIAQGIYQVRFQDVGAVHRTGKARPLTLTVCAEWGQAFVEGWQAGDRAVFRLTRAG
jgi:hypothetical protein